MDALSSVSVTYVGAIFQNVSFQNFFLCDFFTSSFWDKNMFKFLNCIVHKISH